MTRPPLPDEVLTRWVTDAADRHDVSPAPLAEIHSRVQRSRRRRALSALATVGVAVVATILSVVAATEPRGHQVGDAGVPRPTSTPSATPTAEPTWNPSGQTRELTDLEGTWTVTALVGDDPTVSLLHGSAPGTVVLTFHQGQVTGNTGCNAVFGTYEQSGSAGQDLVFNRGGLGSTLKGCPDEPPLSHVLAEVRHVTGGPATLKVTHGRGPVRYLHAANGQILVAMRLS